MVYSFTYSTRTSKHHRPDVNFPEVVSFEALMYEQARRVPAWLPATGYRFGFLKQVANEKASGFPRTVFE